MIKKLICAAALLMVAGLQHTRAQYVYGTTGLLHAPQRGYAARQDFFCAGFPICKWRLPRSIGIMTRGITT